jgi:hypothetical protein
MNPVDYKKKDKDLYFPPQEPVMVDVPEMVYIMVDGQGDPNHSSEFQSAIEWLYALSYHIRMAPKRGQAPDGYFPHVVPPLEGLWGISGDQFDFTRRDNWLWTVMIRQPEFVTENLFASSVQEVVQKKKLQNFSESLRLERLTEGSCVQIMHTGDYESEPESVEKMQQYCAIHHLVDQVELGAKHHEIYLSDPRKVLPDKRKTVLRHPAAIR